MQYLSLGNPIWSGQFAMLGGWRRVFWSTGTYALILFGGCVVAYKSNDPHARIDGTTWALKILPYIQLGLLFTVGTSARLKAMIRDHQSHMMESIRISPMRAATVVLGYLFGPLATTLICWVIGIVAGLGLLTVSGLGGASAWVTGNALMFVSAMAAWSLQVFLGVGQKKPNNVLFVFYVIAFIAHFAEQSLLMLPGFGLVTGIHAASVSIPMMDGALRFGPGVAISMVSGLVMTIFWCWAAARRFRRPDRPALSITGALILCALCALMGIISIYKVDTIYAGSQLLREPIAAGMCMTLCAIMLVLMAAPVSSAVQMYRLGILSAPNPLLGVRSWVVPVAFITLCLSVVTMWSVMVDADLTDYRLVNSVLILTAGCMTYYGALKLACFVKGKPSSAWAMVAAYWIIPALLAVVWHGAQVAREVRHEGDSLGVLFSLSPIGALVSTWTKVQAPMRVGIAIQFGVAIVALILGFRAQRVFRWERSVMLSEPAPIPDDNSFDFEIKVEGSYSVPSNSGDDI